MNPRIVAAVGLPALLLAIVGYLVLFHQPDYEVHEPGGAGTGARIGKPVGMALEEEHVDNGPGEGERQELGKAETGGGETVGLDPFFQRSLSGFKGRIVDHEKQPAPHKLIRFYRLDPSAVLRSPGLFHLDEDVTHAAPRVETKEARTDEEGCFLVTGAWPGTFHVYEADADGEQVTRRFVQRTPGPGEIIDLGDIVLQLHGVIAGQVENEEGEPVAGALVRAVDLGAQVPVAAMAAVPLERFDIEGALIVRANKAPLVIEFPGWAKTYYDMIPIPKTRTNAEGQFRLTGVMPGMNVLAVNARDLLPRVIPMVKVRPGREKNVRTIRLKEGEFVDGRVTDEEGEPVAGAEVVVANRSPGIPLDFAGRHGPTDKDGRFSGSGFRPGAVTAAARTGPGEPWVVVGPTSATSNLVIELPSRHSLTVRLKSNVAAPIRKATFKLLPSHGYNATIDMGTMGLLRWIDVDDRIERLEDGRYHIKELRKGRYDLAVQVEGHGVGRLEVELTGDLESEIQLFRQTPFQVIVTDSAGSPVQNAVIHARSRRSSQQGLHDMPLRCGRTGKDGRLVVDCIQQGQVRVTATHPAYGNVHAQFETPETTEVRLAFQAPGAITGLLTENGGQPTPGKWTIAVGRLRDGARGAIPDLPRLQVPNAEGEFEVKGLTPGKHRVQVARSMDAVTSPGGVFAYIQRQAMGSDSPRVEITLAPGGTGHVVLDAIKQPEMITGPKARIQGTILLNGRPGAGLVVRGWARRWFTVTADAAGRFDLGERRADNWIHFEVLKPEDVNIFNTLSGRRNRSLYTFRHKVEDGEDLDLDIVIETGRAAGTVFGVDGLPAANVRVQATGVVPARNDGQKPVSITQSANTDARGRFEFDALPAGDYTFQVRGKEGHGAITDIEVPAGPGTTGLTIRLAEVYEVSGRVDMAFFGDRKPGWMWLRVRRQGSKIRPMGVPVNGKDGTFTVRNLPPGRYTVSIHAVGSDRRRPLMADPFEVRDRGITGLVLRPRPVPKPEPGKAKKKKKKKKG